MCKVVISVVKVFDKSGLLRVSCFHVYFQGSLRVSRRDVYCSKFTLECAVVMCV